ncbi:hypothetical protein ID866_12615, partial [Astraeus odoratus]
VPYGLNAPSTGSSHPHPQEETLLTLDHIPRIINSVIRGYSTHKTPWSGYWFLEPGVFVNVQAPDSYEAFTFLGDVLGDVVTGSTWSGDHHASFLGQKYLLLTLADPPLPFIKGLLWELAGLAFWYNLLMLDKVLVPPMWEVAAVCKFWDVSLPEVDHGPFHSEICSLKALAWVNAFRTLMAAWPDVPTFLTEAVVMMMSNKELEKWHADLQLHYLETFFANSGHCPALLASWRCSYVGT